MKIVYVSGVKFGYSLLEEILEHNFEISAVILTPKNQFIVILLRLILFVINLIFKILKLIILMMQKILNLLNH